MVSLERTKTVVAALSLEEKVSLTYCNLKLTTAEIPRMKISSLKLPYELLCNPANFAALGCTYDRTLIKEMGAIRGVMSVKSGEALGGVVSVGVTRCPYEPSSAYNFNEDAFAVSEMAAAYISGSPVPMIANRLLDGEYMFSSRYMDPRTMYELYLKPYFKVAKNLGGVVMPAGAINDEIVSQSKLITNIIKEKLPSSALIINEMGSSVDRAAAVSICSGISVGDNTEDNARLFKAVDSGKIPESSLNNCVSRLLSVAIEHNEAVKNQPYVNVDAMDVVERLAKESIVLLKNEILPIKSPYSVFGDITPLQITGCFARASKSKKETIALIVLRVNQSLSDKQIQEVKNRSLACDTVVALICDHPIELPFIDNIKALFYVPLDSSFSLSLIEPYLLGEQSPSGKLNVSWAKSQMDYPANFFKKAENRGMFCYESVLNGYRYFKTFSAPVLFPFGAGLSYSKMEITKLDLSIKQDDLLIKCIVKNVGESSCGEVIFAFGQLGGDNILGLQCRLMGFERIYLDGNENTAVLMSVNINDFGVYDYKNSEWLVPGGKMKISVGFSSEDIRQTEEIKVPRSTRYNLGLDAKTIPSYFQKDRFDPLGIDVEKVLKMPLIVSDRPIDKFCAKNIKNKKLIKSAAKSLAKLGVEKAEEKANNFSEYALTKLLLTK